jgi:hypothetical protein
MFLPIAAGLIVGYAPGEGDAGIACCHRVPLLSFFLIVGSVELDQRPKRAS